MNLTTNFATSFASNFAINPAIIKALVMNEVRLRMRRTSTLVALLAVMAISWAMIADPANGSALIVVDSTRVLYTSSTLAVGSASLGCIMFGLGAFYLVRGRVGEDIRSGTGSVIGATSVGNVTFLLGRWAGNVAYLCAMVLAFMSTIMLLHAVRGDGPIEPLVYLEVYLFMLLPLILFTASCATLFDSWAPLMGKGGDVLYFILWAAQMGVVMPAVDSAGGAIPLVQVFDFNGLGASMLVTTQALHSTHVSLGGGDFKAALAPITMTSDLWSAQLIAIRSVTGLLALLPLLLAVPLFHRFSPDKVKLSSSAKRRAPLAMLNQWLKPLSRFASPLFGLAARLPGMPGQVMGDVALTFATSPVAMLALAGFALAGTVAAGEVLPGVLLAAAMFWGVLVSDVSTRDYAAGTEDMTGAVEGGVARRYLRQFAATLALALLFTGSVALRWSFEQPGRALALVIGVAALSALATCFGRCSRTARLFLGLFLFWAYVALNGVKLPTLDIIGSAGAANAGSMLLWAAGGAVALAAGYWWNRRSL